MDENNEPPTKKIKMQDTEQEILNEIEALVNDIEQEKKAEIIELEEELDINFEDSIKQQQEDMKKMIEEQKKIAMNKKIQKKNENPKVEEPTSKYYEKQIRAYSLKDNHKRAKQLINTTKEMVLEGFTLRGKVDNIPVVLTFQNGKFEKISSVECNSCKNSILWCPHTVALIYKFNLSRNELIDFSTIQTEVQSLDNGILSKAVLAIIRKRPDFLPLFREEVEILKKTEKEYILDDLDSLPFATSFKSKENFIDLSAFTSKVESIIKYNGHRPGCNSFGEFNYEYGNNCRSCGGSIGKFEIRLISIIKISYNISKHGDHYNAFLISLTLLRDYMAFIIEKDEKINIQMIRHIVENLQKISLAANFDNESKEEFMQFISELEKLEYVQDDKKLQEYIEILKNSLESGWDSPDLIAVFKGELKEFKESDLVADIRIKKLKEEERYQELLNYSIVLQRHFTSCEAYLFLGNFSESIRHAMIYLTNTEDAINLIQLFISFEHKLTTTDREKAYQYCKAILLNSKLLIENLSKTLIFFMIDIVSSLDQKYLGDIENYLCSTNLSNGLLLDVATVLLNKELNLSAKRLITYLIQKNALIPYDMFSKFVSLSLNEKETLIPLIKNHIKDLKYITGVTQYLPEILGHLFISTLKSTNTIKEQYFPKDNLDQFFIELKSYTLEPFSKFYSNINVSNFYKLFQILKEYKEKAVDIIHHCLKEYTKALFPYQTFFEINFDSICSCNECSKIKMNLKDPKIITFNLIVEQSGGYSHVMNISNLKTNKRLQIREEERIQKHGHYSKKVSTYYISKIILPSDNEIFQMHNDQIEEMAAFLLNYKDEGIFKDMNHIGLSLFLVKHLVNLKDSSAIIYYSQADTLYQNSILSFTNSNVGISQFNGYYEKMLKLRSSCIDLYKNLDENGKIQFIQKFEKNVTNLDLALQYAKEHPVLRKHLVRLYLQKLNTVKYLPIINYLLIKTEDHFIPELIIENFHSKDLENIEHVLSISEECNFNLKLYLYLLELYSTPMFPKDNNLDKDGMLLLLKTFKSNIKLITQKILQSDPNALSGFENPLIQLEFFKYILEKKDKTLFSYIFDYIEKFKDIKKKLFKENTNIIIRDEIKSLSKEITNEFQNILLLIQKEDEELFYNTIKRFIPNFNFHFLFAKLLISYPNIEIQREFFLKIVSKISKKSIPFKNLAINDQDLEWYYSKIPEVFVYEENITIYHQRFIENGYTIFKAIQHKPNAHSTIFKIFNVLEKKILPNPEFIIKEKPNCSCEICKNTIIPFLESPTSYNLVLPSSNYHPSLKSIQFCDFSINPLGLFINKRFLSNELFDQFIEYEKQLKEITGWLISSEDIQKIDLYQTENPICYMKIIESNIEKKDIENLKQMIEITKQKFQNLISQNQYNIDVPGLKEYLNNLSKEILELTERVKIATQPEEEAFIEYYSKFIIQYNPKDYFTLKDRFGKSVNWEKYKLKFTQDLSKIYIQQNAFRAPDGYSIQLIQNQMEIMISEGDLQMIKNLQYCLIHDPRLDQKTIQLIIHCVKNFNKYRLDLSICNQVITPVLKVICPRVSTTLLFQVTDFISDFLLNVSIEILALRIDSYKSSNFGDVHLCLRKLVNYYMRGNRLNEWKIYFDSVLLFYNQRSRTNASALRGDQLLVNPKPVEVIVL